MILVFGATGNVGREVVARLAERGEKVRAFTRDPARAHFDDTVEVWSGDLGDPDGIRGALAGAERVFMLSAGPDARGHDLAVAEEVRRAGTPRVVRVSSVAALPPVNTSYGAAHADADRAFAESGTALTLLSPAGFMTNVFQWRESIRHKDTVFGTSGQIARALIAPADVAEVAVHALLEGGHEGRNYTVTGPEALTAPQTVERISAALGRPLEYVEAPVTAARQAMLGVGLPADYVDGLLAVQADADPVRGGEVLPTVEQVTGSPARRFDDWLAAHLDAFR
ncbi:NAD(P)H-binding protein [Streptacidiphilus sp. PAMC 29251]